MDCRHASQGLEPFLQSFHRAQNLKVLGIHIRLSAFEWTFLLEIWRKELTVGQVIHAKVQTCSLPLRNRRLVKGHLQNRFSLANPHSQYLLLHNKF